MLRFAFGTLSVPPSIPDTRTPQEKARDTRNARKEQEAAEAAQQIADGETPRAAKRGPGSWEYLKPKASKNRKRGLSNPESVAVAEHQAENDTDRVEESQPANKKRKKDDMSSQAKPTRSYKPAKLQAVDNSDVEMDIEPQNERVVVVDVVKGKGKGKARVNESADSDPDPMTVSDAEKSNEEEDEDEGEMKLEDEVPFCPDEETEDHAPKSKIQPKPSTSKPTTSTLTGVTFPEPTPPPFSDDEGVKDATKNNEFDESLMDFGMPQNDAAVGQKQSSALNAHRRVASLPLNVVQERGKLMSTKLPGKSVANPPSTRNQKHQNEVPTSAEVPALTRPDASRDKRVPNGRGNDGAPAPTATPKPTQTRTQWPQETRIVPPAKSGTLLVLKDQPPTLAEVISLTVILAREHLLQTDGWPSSMPSIRPFITSSAQTLRDDPSPLALKDETRDVRKDAGKILYRSQNDPDYGGLIVPVVIHRQGLLRTNIKDIAADVMPEILELIGLSRKEVSRKIDLLLEDEHFAFPWDDELDEYDTSRPLCTEVIFATVSLTTFGTSNLSANLTKTLPDAFVMTNPKTNEQYPGVPLTILSMAAVAVEFILKQWRQGDLVPAKSIKFTAETSTSRHAEFLAMLTSAQIANPDQFQTYMTDIYTEIRDGHGAHVGRMKAREKKRAESGSHEKGRRKRKEKERRQKGRKHEKEKNRKTKEHRQDTDDDSTSSNDNEDDSTSRHKSKRDSRTETDHPHHRFTEGKKLKQEFKSNRDGSESDAQGMERGRTVKRRNSLEVFRRDSRRDRDRDHRDGENRHEGSSRGGQKSQKAHYSSSEEDDHKKVKEDRRHRRYSNSEPETKGSKSVSNQRSSNTSSLSKRTRLGL